MDERVASVAVRRLELPADAEPIPIFVGDPPEPISTRWLSIHRVTVSRDDWSAPRQSFTLDFYAEDHSLQACLQFETLEIALDQGQAIAGIEKTAWHECEIPIDDHDPHWPTTF